MCATSRVVPPRGRQLLLRAIAVEGEEDGAGDFDGEEREGKGTVAGEGRESGDLARGRVTAGGRGGGRGFD
jgi:hypothetical protein